MPKRAPRLIFTEDEQTAPKVAKAAQKASKAADRLEKAEAKIPKKTIKKQMRVVDQKTGKVTTRLYFEEVDKKRPPSKLSHAVRDAPGVAVSSTVHRKLREAVLRIASSMPQASDLSSQAQSHICAVVLDEIRSLPVEEFGLPIPADARLQRIAKALIANPADERSIDDWANFGAISSRTLSRRFVSETGFNFTAWRQRVRLLRSLEMLAEGISITAIALDLGYASISAYISLFRRTFGETPACYRSRLKAV